MDGLAQELRERGFDAVVETVPSAHGDSLVTLRIAAGTVATISLALADYGLRMSCSLSNPHRPPRDLRGYWVSSVARADEVIAEFIREIRAAL